FGRNSADCEEQPNYLDNISFRTYRLSFLYTQGKQGMADEHEIGGQAVNPFTTASHQNRK
ncbi:MAG: hypothetical protein ACE37N_01185, partial [Pseudohongiellaceae bacterium]